jgi:hypothetical protein
MMVPDIAEQTTVGVELACRRMEGLAGYDRRSNRLSNFPQGPDAVSATICPGFSTGLHGRFGTVIEIQIFQDTPDFVRSRCHVLGIRGAKLRHRMGAIPSKIVRTAR